MKNIEMVKTAVCEYVNAHPGTSYVELERLFDKLGYDYHGEAVSCTTEYENIVFWSGWSFEAFDIIHELVREGKIRREPCQQLIYLIDGKALSLPICTGKARDLRRECWLPTVFNAGKGKIENNQS